MRRGRHPNSRANLRPPWAPGESGNPTGRPSGGLRAAIEEYMATPPEEWPAVTAAQLGIGSREARAMRGARVRCSVCRHRDLAAIDGLLILGAPIRAVAENYTLTRSAVDRHKQNHLPAAPRGRVGPGGNGGTPPDR